MTAIHVEVTAEHIAAGLDPTDPGTPIAAAIEALAGVGVNVDGDGDGPDAQGHYGWMATIGASGVSTCVVVDLPAEANAWLNARWDGEGPGEPFAFDIELSTWLTDLIRIAGGTADLVTLTEAARVLDLEPQTLRHAANALRDGVASPDALAGRLGIRRVGRDWLVPRDRLEVEVARRVESAV